MPTDRSSSSKRPTTRRSRSASGKGPANEKLQSFDFEQASGRDDFGAGLADDSPSPRSSSRHSSEAESPSSSDASGTRRRRTIASKPRFSPPPAAERSEPSGGDESSYGGSRGAAEPTDYRPDRSYDNGDRGGDSSFQSEREEGGGGRRSRRRRRGRGGEGQSGSSGQRSLGGRAPAPSGRSGRDRNNSRGQSSDRGSASGGGRYGRSSQQSAEPRRGRGERRSLSSPPGQRHAKFMQHAPIPTGEIVGELELMTGILELHPKGYGFLRMPKNDYGAEDSDPFVSSSLIEKHKLREGIKILGNVGMGVRGQGPRMVDVQEINDGPVEAYEQTKNFDELTPINPFEQIRLETGTQPITMRVMDLLTPIGKGTRALIVAPPRSGKTMLLQDIANSVTKNHPEIHLIVLLVDERPEEVTDMRRNVQGEVIASSMDRDVESHVRISQLVFERGKRLAESGKHCLILMDSITRCARAFNKWIGGGRDSKIGTGGLDNRALEIPRRMFGTARRFEEGGSLTVVATALIETGNRMDDSIFLEFKGTGNMELVLSRDLAERRVWPAIDVSRSGTRRDEKILSPDVIEGVTMLRRSLAAMPTTEAMEQLVRTLQKFPSNKEFLEKIRSVL